MNQALIKGFGGVTFVDDAGHRQSIGTSNYITDIGLERILSADIALRDRGRTFTSLLLTHGLPTDRDVFTSDELKAYETQYIDIVNYTSNAALKTRQVQTHYSSNVTKTPNGGFTYDVISLAYTDGLGNWYICSRAKAINSETLAYQEFVIPGNSSVTVYYTLVFAFHSGEGITVNEIDHHFTASVGTSVTLDGEYYTYLYDNGRYSSRSTRQPYVPGSYKAQWIYDAKGVSSATIECWFFFDTFGFSYKVPINSSHKRGMMELEFIRPEESMETLGIAIVPPEPIVSTVSITHIGNGDYQNLVLLATPLTQIYLHFDDRLIATIYTDGHGYGTAVVPTYYYDPATESSRSINDGVVFKAIMVNDAGRLEQNYIPRDIEANRIYHAYWKDNDTLHLIGRINDKVQIFIKLGYVSEGTVVTQLTEVGQITLTTADRQYGIDGAVGDIKLDLVKDYKLLPTSQVIIRVTDAAGNVSDYDDTNLVSIGNLNIPDVFSVRGEATYGASRGGNSAIYTVSLITKGFIS